MGRGEGWRERGVLESATQSLCNWLELLLLRFTYFILCVSVLPVCTICTPGSVGTQKGTGSPKTGVTHVCGSVLGISLRPSGRRVSGLTCWATSPDPLSVFVSLVPGPPHLYSDNDSCFQSCSQLTFPNLSTPTHVSDFVASPLYTVRYLLFNIPSDNVYSPIGCVLNSFHHNNWQWAKCTILTLFPLCFCYCFICGKSNIFRNFFSITL